MYVAVPYSCNELSIHKCSPLGNHLEGKSTAAPLRKPHGAAVYPLHDVLTSGLSGDQEEKDIQMDVFVYVS